MEGHLDEVYVKINGEMHYLWRAVDQEGEVLERYVTKSRDKAAALTFMKKALNRYVPRSSYMKRIVQAHRLHHAPETKDGSVSFGFIWAMRP
jgi:transposase-like protein